MANPRTLDEQIAESIRRSQESGELQTAKDWGKRTAYADGYEETPEEYRMAFKALKDSGYVPAEVEMMKALADKRARLSTIDASSSEALALKREISELQLKVSVRLENIARGGY
ncbi:DnaJ family domain-containing protein [Paraburkholderia phenazinium]|jgi:flagellar biosynthesis/type III secretory pathway protein FliH|uniref:DnaJ homologue subfamily C member 28 conserved domain-containing protein n=2 Tax=Paraburkholderia TaxID=1822464 RepID=A0A1N6K5U3_9BURK|nr:DnaJ family domain-containing protein [Paraburkholderia phenazinium]SIO51687.1 protein of unknown function [Paraburkholderia phenazinium]